MKRLYRNRENDMIAGVCSGIAEYLAVDPTAIRLAFVLLAFLGGSGISIYIVLWIIMPVKGSEAIKEVENSAKPAPKKIAEKSTEKKSAPVSKSAAKTTAAKKAPAKKPAAKTASAKKTPAKKPAAKKTPTKKPAAKSSTEKPAE